MKHKTKVYDGGGRLIKTIVTEITDENPLEVAQAALREWKAANVGSLVLSDYGFDYLITP